MTLTTILCLVIGLVASLLGSMAGLGGGFLSIPLLLYLGIEPHLVIGSTKFMVLINSGVSICRYIRRVKFPYKLYITIVVPMILSAYIGAYLVVLSSSEILMLVISTVLLAGSLRILLGSEKIGYRNTIIHRKYYIGFLSGILAGFIAGITGLGGGVVNMPIFINILNLEPHIAVSLSMACIFPSAISSTARHLIDNVIDWNITLPLSIGAVIGGFIGPRISLGLEKEKLRKIIGLLIFLAMIRTLYVSIYSILT